MGKRNSLMIYNLYPETVGAYTLHFDDLNGDVKKVKPEEDLPEFGPDCIMRAHYFRSGKRLQTEHIPTQIRPKRRKGRLPDYAGHALAQVCSQAFRDVVEQHDPGLHQFVPVEIVWKDGSVYEVPYYWLIPGVRLKSLHPTLSNPPLDKHRHYDGFTSFGKPGPGPVQPVFQAEIVKDHDFFCEYGLTGYLYASEKLKDALTTANLTGVGFGAGGPLV